MIVKEERKDGISHFFLKLIDDNGKIITISMGGNLDLYWTPQKGIYSFVVGVKDEQTFKVLTQLLNNVKNVDDKYNPSFNGDVFTFISDDKHESQANKLQMLMCEEQVEINFLAGDGIEPWQRVFKTRGIHFCNSGSRKPRVVYEFMKMYSELVRGDLEQQNPQQTQAEE